MENRLSENRDTRTRRIEPIFDASGALRRVPAERTKNPAELTSTGLRGGLPDGQSVNRAEDRRFR